MLRISTVVDNDCVLFFHKPFGSAKNFYCCRLMHMNIVVKPLEVLRISTVVDNLFLPGHCVPLEVLRISTVVDRL